MMPEEVGKAVVMFDSLMKFAGSENAADWQTIRARLLAREAEVERLHGEIQRQYECIHSHAVITRKAEDRAERAEALLREAWALLDRELPNEDLTDTLFAHLSENSRGCHVVDWNASGDVRQEDPMNACNGE